MTLAKRVPLGGSIRRLETTESHETLQQLRGVAAPRLSGDDDYPLGALRGLPDQLGRDRPPDLGAVGSSRPHPFQNHVGDGDARHFEVEVLGVFEVTNRCDAEEDRYFAPAVAKRLHEALELV